MNINNINLDSLEKEIKKEKRKKKSQASSKGHKTRQENKQKTENDSLEYLNQYIDCFSEDTIKSILENKEYSKELKRLIIHNILDVHYRNRISSQEVKSVSGKIMSIKKDTVIDYLSHFLVYGEKKKISFAVIQSSVWN